MKREIGRFEIETYSDKSGTTLRVREYPNHTSIGLSLEEMHDLRFMLDRQIAHVEADRRIHR